MVQKHPLCPDRIRQVPKQFSWIDHRLVRDRHIDRCSHRAAALYLFLVTVADAQGLSYYSDRSLSQRLSMEENCLAAARQDLIRIELVAYKHPLYQVLALQDGCQSPSTTTGSSAQFHSLGQIFKQLGRGAS
jgi:hypothetical protein